jgi:hypothetical protein
MEKNFARFMIEGLLAFHPLRSFLITRKFHAVTGPPNILGEDFPLGTLGNFVVVCAVSTIHCAVLA